MAPQLIFSTVSGPNLMDIDFSYHLSPKKDRIAMPNLPGFHARAQAGMAIPFCFWAEMMAAVNLYKI
jgi:hypothetical protein